MKALIDIEILCALRDSIHNQKGSALVDEIVGLFLENAQASLESLTTACESKDRVKLQRSLHQLRGICLNVGANRLAEEALNLELNIQKDPQAPVSSALENLQKISKGTFREIEAQALRLRFEAR